VIVRAALWGLGGRMRGMDLWDFDAPVGNCMDE